MVTSWEVVVVVVIAIVGDGRDVVAIDKEDEGDKLGGGCSCCHCDCRRW